MDALLADAFLYGKVAVAFLAALTDWRLACYYLAAVAVAGVALRQPHYDGPHALVRLTAPAFLATVFDASRHSSSSPSASIAVNSSATGDSGKTKGTPVKAVGVAAEGQLGASKLYKGQDPAVWLVACIDPASPACVQVCPPLHLHLSTQLSNAFDMIL